MSNAVIIELSNHTAGIAVREGAGYRFYASESLFQDIDTRKFRRLREVHAAVDGLLRQRRA